MTEATLKAELADVRAKNRELVAENARLRRKLGADADRPDPEERKAGWVKAK